MGWLSPGAMPAVTGARWSAGAFWSGTAYLTTEAEDGYLLTEAEDGTLTSDTAVGVTGSDWEDPAEWPRTYPVTAERMVLGVWIAGQDRTSWVRSLGWVHGSDVLMAPTLAASSANITLSDDAPTVAVADRVVILTEWDVLWAGRVEDHATDEGMDETTIALSAADGLSRATDDQAGVLAAGGVLTLSTGGLPVLEHLFRASGLPGLIVNDAWHSAEITIPPPYAQPYFRTPQEAEGAGFHDGSIITILADAIKYAGLLGSYTPAGLRVREVGLWMRDTDDVRLADAHDVAARWSTSRRVSDVINRWSYKITVDEATPPVVDGDATSQRLYGTRSMDLTSTPDWMVSHVYNMVHPLAYGDFSNPPERVEASYAIFDTDSLASRIIPLDRLQQDSDDYLALRVSHGVTVDGWTVTISAVAVREITSWATGYPQ